MVKNRRRVLLISALCILLCVALMVGATFAWFTDSVTGGKNTITAGNLDVALEYSTDMVTWASVEGRTDLLDPNALWEPGHTELVYLRITNRGSLALNYRFSTVMHSETGAKNVDNEDFLLSEHLRYGITAPTAAYESREAAIADIANAQPLGAYSDTGFMAAGTASRVLALVVYMPESVDNNANYRGTAPQIELGITLEATQARHESDSFGTDYDAGAWQAEPDTAWYDPAKTEFVLENEGQLLGLSALTNARTRAAGPDFAGKTVKLGRDMNLAGCSWIPIGTFAGTFDGQGYAIRNLKIEGSRYAGLFSVLSGTAKNLTLSGFQVSGSRHVGALAGAAQSATLENCRVTASTVTAQPVLAGTVYTEGCDAGGLVGSAENATFTGCSVTSVSVSAYRSLGGLVGSANGGLITGCDASADLSYVTAENYENNLPNSDLNDLVGSGDAQVEAPSAGLEVEFYRDYIGHYYMADNSLMAAGVQFDMDGDDLLCIMQWHDFEATRAELSQKPVEHDGSTYYHIGAGFEPRHTEADEKEIRVYNSLYEEKGALRFRIQRKSGVLTVVDSVEPNLPSGTLLEPASWYISAPEVGMDFAGNYRVVGDRLYATGVNLDRENMAVLTHNFTESGMGNVTFAGKTYGHTGAGVGENSVFAMTFADSTVTGTLDGKTMLVLRWEPEFMALTVTESQVADLPVGTRLDFAPWNTFGME